MCNMARQALPMGWRRARGAGIFLRWNSKFREGMLQGSLGSGAVGVGTAPGVLPDGSLGGVFGVIFACYCVLGNKTLLPVASLPPCHSTDCSHIGSPGLQDCPFG